MEFKTLIMEEFTAAEHEDATAIIKVYNDFFDANKNNAENLTELSIALNLRLWQHYYAGFQNIAKFYDALWKECHQYCINNLKGEDLLYYNSKIS